MRQTDNLGLTLYDSSDKMNITGSENSLNHNMELLDKAIANTVSKEEGKGLSTYDYDQTSKEKVDAIPENPKYTDTVYDDTIINAKISDLKDYISYSNQSELRLIDCSSNTETADISNNYNFNGWYYNENIQLKLRNRKIAYITVWISTAGTFSIVRTKNIGLSNQSVVKVKTFDVIAGENLLKFDDYIVLEDDESIGFFIGGDTAKIKYDNNSSAYTFFALSGTTKELYANYSLKSIFNFSLNNYYSPYIFYNRLSEKKLSVLGDSTSTFEGFSESNNDEYPANSTNWSNPVLKIEDMWWYKVNEKLGTILDTVNAYGGSRFTLGNEIYPSFITRCTNLGNPDIIIVKGGINELLHTSGNSLGDFAITTGKEQLDCTKFRQAMQKVIMTLLSTYPLASIYVCKPVISNKGRFVKSSNGISYYDICESIDTVCNAFGVNVIDLTKCGITYENMNTYIEDGIHPNCKGMEKIANYIYKYIIAEFN